MINELGNNKFVKNDGKDSDENNSEGEFFYKETKLIDIRGSCQKFLHISTWG